jgi:hypothetical protein
MTALPAPALASARDFIADFARAYAAKDTFDGRLTMKRLGESAVAEVAALDSALALIEAAKAQMGAA